MPKKVDFGFTPSKYQQDIFDFVQHGVGNAVVKAKAGSAKTTTMVAAMQLIPKSRKCLFIAFNKPIVDELNQKLKGRSNCTAKTIHGLGYSIICANFDEKPSLDEYKYRNYLKNNVCELSQIDCEGTTREILEEYVDNVSQLIHFSRYNLCQTVKEIKEIAQRYDIPYHHDECEVTLKCLQWGKKNTNTIDYTDMVWLPYELGLSGKGNQYDWVFFDEAQDASKAYVDVFLRTFKRGTRFMAVGDDFQRINLFAGSSQDAFDYLAGYGHTQIFDLPICYRCDKKIIELSQTLVPDIQYRDDAPDGVVMEDCHLDEVKDGDMVLCRSKAPLMRLYTRFIKKGVNCYIKGKEIGSNLITLIKSVDTEIIGRELISDGLFIRLYERLINLRNNVMKKHNLDIWDASLSFQVMELYDQINVLITLSESCKTTGEMVERIESIFQDDANGICLSTIHKAKGLEADNVFVICRSTMPPKRAKKDWEKLQEQNLIYVAYTRAKHKLGFISEVEVPPAGSSLNDDDIVNDIAFIEKQVCRVLGTPLTEDNASANFAKFRLKAATEIEDRHANDNVVVIKRNEVPVEETSLDDLLASLD